MNRNFLSTLLIVLGISLFVIFSAKNFFVEYMQNKAYESIDIQTVDSKPVQQTKTIEEITLPSEKDVIKALFSDKNTTGVGLISIPSVNLQVPIFREMTNANLLKGAGVYNEIFQGFNEGNTVLVGHHMKKEGLLFQPLTKLKKGESIYITDNKKVYQYKVEEPFIVHEKETWVAEENFNGITLITCDVPTPTEKRLIFQAQLVNVIEKNNEDEFNKLFN